MNDRQVDIISTIIVNFSTLRFAKTAERHDKIISTFQAEFPEIQCDSLAAVDYQTFGSLMHQVLKEIGFNSEHILFSSALQCFYIKMSIELLEGAGTPLSKEYLEYLDMTDYQSECDSLSEIDL